jgi:hypothetical protein
MRMSMDLAKGYPDSAVTPTRVVAAGLFVGGAILVSMWAYGDISRWLTSDPTVAPPCYRAEAGPFAEVKLPEPFRQKHENAIWNNPRGNVGIERLLAAEQACTALSCDAKAWQQYRSGLFWYLAERLHRSRRLEAIYGDDGLKRAQELFGGDTDRRIERGLRDRYTAGIFRIKDFRQNQDAIAILVLAGGQALRSCPRTAGPAGAT